MWADRACSEGKHRSRVKKKGLGRRENQLLVSTVCLEAQNLRSPEKRSRKLFPALVCLKILPLWPVVSALWLTKHLLQGVGPAVSLTGLLLTCFREPTTAKRNYLLLEARKSIGTLANNHFGFLLFAKHFSTLYVFMRYFPRRGSWRRLWQCLYGTRTDSLWPILVANAL